MKLNTKNPTTREVNRSEYLNHLRVENTYLNLKEMKEITKEITYTKLP